MYGWMDEGLMGGCMDRWMGEWMYGWVGFLSIHTILLSISFFWKEYVTSLKLVNTLKLVI